MLKKITKTIENILNLFPSFFGKISSWLILLMIFLSSMIVILRYVFEIGVVAMQELLVYSHGMLFLFYAALALKDDAHVRVDIFYRELSVKRKRMINILGNLFFLQPFAWVILIFSFEYVHFSWSINEISPEPGGLPFVYLFKTSLIIFPILLIFQSFSELTKLIFNYD
jgi:TRAP-type mannitol/chloroaromatic compound transport system permease small subunit